MGDVMKELEDRTLKERLNIIFEDAWIMETEKNLNFFSNDVWKGSLNPLKKRTVKAFFSYPNLNF